MTLHKPFVPCPHLSPPGPPILFAAKSEVLIRASKVRSLVIWPPIASLVSSSTVNPHPLNHTYSGLLAVTEHTKHSPNSHPLPGIRFLQLFLRFFKPTYSDLTDEHFYKIRRFLPPPPPLPSPKYHCVSSLHCFSSITFIIRHVYFLALLRFMSPSSQNISFLLHL